jgi:signal transduction histidine kinase
LPSALTQIAERTLAGAEIAFDLETRGTTYQLDEGVTRELTLIAQEALFNAMCHARPSRVCITLEFSFWRLRMVIADDGCGFDMATVRGVRDGHCGLTSMRERAEAIGARFSLASRPGAGTEVAVVLNTLWNAVRVRPSGK